jgi:hypothetical protein
MNTGGSATTIVNAAGNAVTLNAGGNTIRGLTISGTSGAGIIGTAVTNLTVGSDVSMSGVSGADLDLSGAATGTVSFGATVTNTAGRSISVQNRTGGTVDITGAISDTGTGILLNSNTGATINFTGGISLSTGANAAFTATAGGTVNATQNNTTIVNTLTTTTGTALTVTSTTIGASGLTFRSISSTSAPNGINLNTTGAGGLTVTGNGGACTLATTTCTGGSIQTSTAEGILLNSASATNLSLMKVQTSGTDGIHMTGGTSFTLNNSIVTDNNVGAAADEGIEFDNVGGTITISGSAVTGSPHNAIFFDNLNTNLTAFNMTGSTIGNNLSGANGLLVTTRGTSVITAATITGCTFTNSFSTGIQVLAEDTSNIQNFIIGQPGAGNGNTFSGNNAAIDMDQSQAGNHTFRVVNNTFNFNFNANINVFAATASTGGSLTGFIQSNVIGTPGSIDSGGGHASGPR